MPGFKDIIGHKREIEHLEKAISTENQSVSVEHISHWLDKYDGKYAASPCS